MVRARWAAASWTARPLMATAAAFESVTDEFTFVIGPVLATALCTGVHPAAGLIAEAALTLVGGLLFAAQRRTAPARCAATPPARARPAHLRAVACPGVRVLAVAFLRRRRGLRRHAGLADRVRRGDRPPRRQRRALRDLRGRQHAGRRRLRRRRLAVHAPRGGCWPAYAALALVCSTLWAAHSAPLLGRRSACWSALCIAPTLITGYTLVDDAGPGRRPHRGVHLADRRGRARPGGRRRRSPGG